MFWRDNILPDSVDIWEYFEPNGCTYVTQSFNIVNNDVIQAGIQGISILHIVSLAIWYL